MIGKDANETSMIIGRHHIRWAILPHTGPLDHRTVRTAQNFNHPLKLYALPSTSSTSSNAATTSPSPASSSSSPSSTPTSKLLSSLTLTGSPALILDCIKRGEDDEDVSRGSLPAREGRSIIVRIYESLGGRARGVLGFADLDIKKVWKCNLLEDDGEEVEILRGAGEGERKGKGVKVDLKPFEVGTWRLQLS